MELAKLEEIQLDSAKKVIKRDVLKEIKIVGGIDVTFEKAQENPTKAWACIVVFDLDTLKPIYQKIVEDIVDFPYIPTFLAFRELPLMKKVYNEAKTKPDVIFIDGQGISHPRSCGIASHFGIEVDAVTVGVAKKKLLGSYEPLEDSRGSYSYLIYNDSIIGAVVRTRDKIKPVFVSIGHKISLEKAIELVLKTSIYRIPEPLRLAHNLLQRVRKNVFL